MRFVAASLRLKLSAVFAVAALVIVGVVTATRTVMRRGELEVDLRREATLYAQLLARELEPAVGFEDEATAREVLESIAIDDDVARIGLFDERGAVIAGSVALPVAWAENTLAVVTRTTSGTVEVAAPVVSREGPRAMLYLTFSTERIRVEARRTLWVTGGLGVALLSLAVLAGWFAAGLMVRRIARIATVADRVAHGDFSAGAVAPGAPDELGRLTVGFNVMLERVRTEQERLARLVDERTAELSASREQFRLIVETTRAIPFEYALDQGRFTYVGPQTLAVLGYSVDEWMAPGFTDRLFESEDGARSREQMRAALAASGEYDVEVKVRAKNRQELNLRWSAARSGNTVRGLVLDVTERWRLEQELHQAQRLESVGRLASGVAHEINTPAQFSSDSMVFVRDAWADVMGLFAEYREKAGANAEREQAIDLEYVQENVPKSVDRALDGVSRIAEIVKSMKAFAQPDQTEKTAYDVKQGLQTTLIIAKNEYKYVADIETRLADVPTVIGCPGDLNQVWLALLTNAAQAIGDRGGHGKITVGATEVDGAVVVSIADTGCGIPDSVRPHVFDQFFTTRQVGKGKGQGLSMARAVISGHGGDISFESKVGEGTTFFVRLPAESQV